MVQPSRSTTGRPARAGISLLAILITLCAIAVAALVAIPAFFGRTDVTLDNACRLLVKDLRSAQNRAAFLKTEAVFAFNENGWVATNRLGGPLSRANAPDELARDLARDGVFEGVRIRRIDFGEDRSLVFSERGVALEAGEVELVFRGDVRVVRVEVGTGLATIFDGEHMILADDRLSVHPSTETSGG